MKHILWIAIVLACLIGCDSDKTHSEPITSTTYTPENSALVNTIVNCVAVDHNDHVWAGNSYGDVTEFDGVQWKHHVTKDSAIYNNSVRKIAVDKNNRIWVASDDGLFHFDDSVWAFDTVPFMRYYTNWLSDAAVGLDNSLWVIASYDLWQYKSGVWSSSIGSQHLDISPNGDIWTSYDTQVTRDNGLQYVHYYPTSTGVAVNNILALEVGANNDLWIGTAGTGVFHHSGSVWTFYNTGNSGLPDDQVRTIMLDRHGHVWIGTEGGLAHFSGTTWTVFNTQNSELLSNSITDLDVDSENRVWVATYLGGITVFTANGL